jgi:hypothetical protein
MLPSKTPHHLEMAFNSLEASQQLKGSNSGTSIFHHKSGEVKADF